MNDGPTYRGQVSPAAPPSSPSTGLTDAQLRATAVPVSQSGSWSFSLTGGPQAVTGPLTDTQLRAVAVPVSAASLPLPAGSSTSAKQDTIIGYIDGIEALLGGTLNVAGAFYPAVQPVNGSVSITGSVAVTGTFWQATQPVSGPLTDAQLRAAVVSVNFTNNSLAVTGPLTDAQIRASALPVSIAATVATRNLKDNARTVFSAATVIGGVACVTTEALLSMVPVRAGVAGSAGTSIAVTAGKTLRLTAIIFSTRSTSAAVLSGRCALRMNPSGAAAANSPILAIASTTQQAAALAEAGDTCVVPLPDGLEISGTQQVGLTQVCSATTGVVYATLIGFEY